MGDRAVRLIDWVHGGSLVRASLIVGAIALVVRLVYLVFVAHIGDANPDSGQYIELANRLARGAPYAIPGYGSGAFPADLDRPPGYPVFLMIVSTGMVTLHRVALVQCVLGAAAAGVLTFGVGRWLGIRVALIAGLLFAIDWATIIQTPVILADVPCAILFTGGLAAVAVSLTRQRVGPALLGGLLLGLAALFKPVALLGLVAVLPAVLSQPKRHWRALACFLTCAVIVLPWAIRNDDKYGLFTLSTIPTTNLYTDFAQTAAQGKVLYTSGQALAIWDRATGALIRLHLTPRQLSSRETSQALTIIGHHLPKVIAQAGVGAVRTAFGTGRGLVAASTGRAVPSIVGTWLPLAEVALLWLLAAAGTVAAWRTRRVARSVVILMVSAVVLSIASSGSVGSARYRVLTVPVVCVFAALGAAEVSSRFRTTSSAGTPRPSRTTPLPAGVD